MAKRKKKIDYIQLEPGAYPKDFEWQAMSTIDRGIYHSLIIYLACNDGVLINAVEGLSNLCNCMETTFGLFWEKYSHKFIERDGRISHKRVTQELAKSRKYLRQKSLAGKASANARSTAAQRAINGDSTAEQLIKTKTNKRKLALELNKLAIIFDEKITKLFGPLTKNECVTFSKIRSFLISFSTTKEINLATSMIAECKQWGANHDKNNVEIKKCFVSKIKKMGWKPNAKK